MVFEASDGQTPLTVAALKTCDYLELENKDPIACVHADWSHRVLKRKKLEVGVLCEGPLLFDAANADGACTWAAAAQKIVVAIRGEEEFESMARRAEASGAVGLVVVDNEDVFDDDFEMASEDPHRPLSPSGLPWSWRARPCLAYTANTASRDCVAREGATGSNHDQRD